MKIIKREIEKQIFKVLEWSPSIVLLGPRQIGKTTLAKYIQEKLKKPSIYLDLEDLDDRKRISETTLFLKENINKCVIIDEIQTKFSII